MRLAGKNSFDGRGAVYESLRDEKPVPGDAAADLVLFEAAVLAARSPYDPDPRFIPKAPSGLPVLLELYRCDELSTFRGPDGYYDACAAYKTYLKNSRNPYRESNGKRRGDALHRTGSGAL